MPDAVAEAVEMMNKSDVDMADVAEVIQRDPALTVKLLKVSNSPYYGMRQVVGSLKLAMVILGAREVRNILLGVSVMDTLDDEKTEGITKGNFWDHSFRVGALSKKLSEHFKLRFQGEDFIAGLLHDIGKLVLYRQIPEAYIPVYERSIASQDRLEDIENEKLGFDHADAAAALAELWNLPETLRDALWFHHPKDGHPIADAKDPKLAAVVRIANLAAEEGLTAEGFDPDDSLAVAEQEAWEAIGKNALVDTPTARFDILREYVKEVDDSPGLKF